MAKKKKIRRLTVLVHEDLIPPEKATKEELETAPWRTEFYVVEALKKAGHDVMVLGLSDELSPLRKNLDEFKPQAVFNLLEEFKGEAILDQNVVSYLELKGIPYTGCNPRGLILARDKALSKKILSYHRIPVPHFQVFPKGRKIRKGKRLSFPLIVKSTVEESSMGISQASVVKDIEKLQERVNFIHENLGTDAIAEEYIDGRELYVGIMGWSRLQVFPIWEMVFEELPEGQNAIATSRVKHNPDYRKKHAIATQRAESLSDAQTRRILHICRRAYKVLNLTGYARIDLRLSENGTPYLIEANPNPDISQKEDFAESANEAGISYGDLLEQIVRLAKNSVVGR